MYTEDDKSLIARNLDHDFYEQQFKNLGELPPDHVSHYLNIGWKIGLDPNEKFSTVFYLARNPDVRESNSNPFLHFLRYGLDEGRVIAPSTIKKNEHSNSIHVAADDYSLIEAEISLDFYRRSNDDLRNAEQNGLDLIEHYLYVGWKEGRDPHPEFSSSLYLELNPDVASQSQNPFIHYIRYGRAEGRVFKPARSEEKQEAVTQENSNEYAILSGEMSIDYYRRNNPDLAAAEKDGLDLIQHYLETGWKEGRDPHPNFSSNSYLEINKDVSEKKVNPFIHYLTEGRKEGRSVFRISDSSKEEIIFYNNTADAKDFERYIWSGYQETTQYGLRDYSVIMHDKEILSFTISANGAGLNEFTQSIILPAFSKHCRVDISIIIPCYNHLQYTLECLHSISKSKVDQISYEVIVVNNGSDDSYDILDNLPNLKILNLSKNEGFGKACNKGFDISSGKYVLILNNDTQLHPECLQILFDTAEDKKNKSKAISPKVLSFDGSLQEAGCIVTERAEGAFVGYGDDHRAPRYNYDRFIEYGSAVALLIERDAFKSVGGFDDEYAPAYYEDVDLCMKLRAAGWTITYSSNAIVVHHLSKTSENMGKSDWKTELVQRNKVIFQRKWQKQLLAQKVKLIAFYLPQYHPIPENDRWWGKGFTEWTNVVKARSNYIGHRQPRKHGDFGYYDLRSPKIMEDQAKLADKYGISGFCYYYYWFSGKKVLEMPLERLLETGKPDFPFCLCWANENWTRTWDGKNSDVLLKQDYNETGDLDVIKDISRFFRSEKYIKIDGRPLILVYRVKSFPLFFRTSQVWRNYCKKIGFEDIIIAAVESFELSACPEDPSKFGCDLSVEFPPHGMVHDPRIPVDVINQNFSGSVHNYRSLAKEYMTREEVGWKRIRSVLVGWDNTPRRQDNSFILEGSTPGSFQAWLEWTIERTIQQNFGDERLVFINAWNEWCEGSYLEPDGDYGHAYLQAVKYALNR